VLGCDLPANDERKLHALPSLPSAADGTLVATPKVGTVPCSALAKQVV
jgi:hypothetical protein